MEITVGLFILLFGFAFICELIDSSLGMGYGTILSPLLLIMGFNPIIAIPSILLSQAFGGLFASLFHHHFHNVSFKSSSKDLKITMVIAGFGILATILAAIVAINIPKIILTSYIGILVIIMGVIIFINKKFNFTWKKIIGLSILSAFNKGLSGGGFGPIVTSGQILSGQKHKSAIGVTTLAEAPICIIAFFAYIIAGTCKVIEKPLLSIPFKDFSKFLFSNEMIRWELILALLLGSILAAPFGALITKKINDKIIHIILGILIFTLGIWTLIKTFFK